MANAEPQTDRFVAPSIKGFTFKRGGKPISLDELKAETKKADEAATKQD